MLNPIRFTRRGGMRFLRVGRLQVSWCVCRAPLPKQASVLLLRRAWLVEG